MPAVHRYHRVRYTLPVSKDRFPLSIAGPRAPRTITENYLLQLFVESGFPFLCFDRGLDLPGVGEGHTFDVEAAAVVDLDG